MEAENWGILTYILGGLAVLFLVMMVVVSLKIIRVLLLIALIVFGLGAYFAHDKKVEEEKLFSAKKFEKGAAKIVDGFKDIGEQLGKDIGTVVDDNLDKNKKEKISEKFNQGMEAIGKWSEKAADKGIEVLNDGLEKTEKPKDEVIE